MTTQNLRQKLHEQKNKVGLVGGTVEIEEYDEMDNYISAAISPKNWEIKISLRKGWNPIQDKRQKAYARAKKIQDGLETLVMHVGGLHEPAHWELPVDSERGCPYNVYWHDKILEAVKQALSEKGRNPNAPMGDKQSLASYVANAFEDLIINPRCREFNHDFSGQVLFWDWEGIRCTEQGEKHYTPFYEAFVKLNIHLFGDSKDRILLKRHYSNTGKVEEAVKKVIGELSLPEDIQDTSPLFRRERWAQMASSFTKNLAPLLDETPKERLSAYSQEGDGEGQGNEQPAGNGIEGKVSTGEGKEEIAFGRYSSGESPSTNLTNYEQLDALYKRLARDIPIEVEVMAREQGLRIAPLNFRPFDPEKDDPAKVKTSKLMATDQGLQFGYARDPLTIVSKSKIQKRSFPDFKMVVLDNSGSMREAADRSEDIGNTSFIPWGDRSKYHYALLGFYGIENFLQKQGIAQYIQHGISMFSSGTRSQEGDFYDLNRVRKQALSPDWGSTNIDAKSLSQTLKGRESFVLSLSDGEIQNWGSEREAFRKLLEGNYFAHIQIGGQTEFTRDLESWGVPVSYVTKGEDLSKLMVKTTNDCYRGFTKE